MTIAVPRAVSVSATVAMLASTIYLYDNEQPVLDYMEYLPVYRVEQLWERREQRALEVERQTDGQIGIEDE